MKCGRKRRRTNNVACKMDVLNWLRVGSGGGRTVVNTVMNVQVAEHDEIL
jgi:hypothetical protein